MKFSLQLEEYQLPEWKGQYISYRALRNRIYKLNEEHGDRVHEVPVPGTRAAPSSPNPWAAQYVPISPKLSPQRIAQRLFGVQGGGSLPSATVSPSAAWREDLRVEALRVKACVDYGLQGLRSQLQDVIKMMPREGEEKTEENMTVEETHTELRIIEALCRVSEGLIRLRGFAELNHAAMYKVLKKHDKVLKTAVGLQEFLPELILITGLGDSDLFDSLDAEIKLAYKTIGKGQGMETSPEVAHLIAGLGTMGRSGMMGSHDATNAWHEQVQCFFLGASLMSFFFLCVFIFLPPLDEQTYSTAYFLVNFSSFRIALSVTLVVFGLGVVSRMCGKSMINHNFLLGVDPRCRVQDKYLFKKAATLAALWVFIYGLYVIDYKWIIFQTSGYDLETDHRFNLRASWHYVLYPMSVIILMAGTILSPSPICEGKYKLGMLASAGRVCLAPFYPVSFGDNMAGDVLTSLSKPLQDIPPALCYLFSVHPQTTSSINRFVDQGQTCPDWVNVWMLPALAAAPFWFRLMQCARRYYDTGETRNLWNFLKYMTSLSVVIVTALWGQQSVFAVIAISTVATIYNSFWDVFMDWGLGVEELSVFAQQIHTERRLSSMPSHYLEHLPENELSGPLRRLSSKSSCHDRGEMSRQMSVCASGGLLPQRMHREDEQVNRYFRPSSYCLAAICDVIMRCSWVLTLLPAEFLSRSPVNRALLQLFTSAIEIARRSLWAVLRMEHEQIANASGYRALLWVPTKLSQDAMYLGTQMKDKDQKEKKQGEESGGSSDDDKKTKKDKKDKKDKKKKVTINGCDGEKEEDVAIGGSTAETSTQDLTVNLEGLDAARQPLLSA